MATKNPAEIAAKLTHSQIGFLRGDIEQKVTGRYHGTFLKGKVTPLGLLVIEAFDGRTAGRAPSPIAVTELAGDAITHAAYGDACCWVGGRGLTGQRRYA